MSPGRDWHGKGFDWRESFIHSRTWEVRILAMLASVRCSKTGVFSISRLTLKSKGEYWY